MAFLAKKSLGQNFLMHPQIAERIVGAAKLPENATIFEIGPGTGMLTHALLAKAGKVIAIEADDALAPQLEETFAAEIASEKLTLIHGDVREFDPTAIEGDYHLIANIPYYITGEIIRSFLTAAHKPASMTLLVQKEVAERIARSAKESLLSLAVKVFGKPEYRSHHAHWGRRGRTLLFHTACGVRAQAKAAREESRGSRARRTYPFSIRSSRSQQGCAP
jgi:16S rRNA (adenine1518-N6/adenine1519-N6)-dimethyltransferase